MTFANRTNKSFSLGTLSVRYPSCQCVQDLRYSSFQRPRFNRWRAILEVDVARSGLVSTSRKELSTAGGRCIPALVPRFLRESFVRLADVATCFHGRIR